MKISLCTVTVESLEPYLELMIKSALEKLNLHEIIICTADAHRPEKEEEVSDVIIRRINLPHDLRLLVSTYSPKEGSLGHALGLHECIDKAQGDYIFFCDPDVIFQAAVDKIYLDFMVKYNLNYIGCVHESYNLFSYKFFPAIINSLVRKDQLPNADFLKDHLHYHSDNCKKATGKYLIPGVIPEITHKFEIPPERFCNTLYFDTGSNLYPWALEKNWRWLSFLSHDCQNYKTSFYRSNFKLKDRIKIQKLLHHQCSRHRSEADCFRKFQQIYEESKEKEDN